LTCILPIDEIQSRALGEPEPATVAGFSFLKQYGDKMGTRKHVYYKPAKIHKGTKWFVYYSYLDPDTGKYRRFKVYEDINRVPKEDQQDYANDLLWAVNMGLKNGYDPFAHKRSKVWTLGQAINYYKQKIPDLGLREKTMQGYYSFVDLFTKYWNKKNSSIDSIDRNDCAALLSTLKKEREWGNTMYNNGLTFGRLMFSFFIQNGITHANPFKQVKPLQETKTGNQPFTDKDWKLILEKAEPDLRRFMQFLYYTGARPNEARQLEYSHILRDRKLVYIPGALSKGKKDGFIPVSDQFLILFPEGDGKIFGTSKNYFTLKFTELKRKLKLNDKYTLYSTKHTRAVHLMQDGASPYSILQLFRHSSLEVTMSYLRDLGINIGREAAEKAR
jgi:integrase